MTKPAILVTGGCGYIGSHVVRQLTEAGRRVIVVDDLSTNGVREALLHGETLHEVDCGDETAMTAVLKKEPVESILHFAALMRPQESVVEPELYYRNNTVNFLRLLQVAVKAKVKHVIFSSTCAVYGTAPRPVRESDATNPESPYGWSKLMSERILRDICAAHGLTHGILRYFNVAGASADGRIGQQAKVSTQIFKIAAEAAAGKRPGVTILGTDYDTPDGSCVRDFVHVVDLADAHIQLLAHLERGGQSDTLNCGYGKGISVKEAVESMRRVTGSKFPVTGGPRRPGDPATISADCSRIKQVLGWQPRFADLDVIAKHAYNWETKL